MIFVTVGTHEQPFNRLLKELDILVNKGIIKEKVIIQSGFSTYKPKYCESKKFFSAKQMTSLIEKAHIVITHGGPASFIQVLQMGKIPIVVPRQVQYGEHINNHQVDFVKLIEKEKNNIIPIYNIEDLKIAIKAYDENISNAKKIISNNKNFNEKFSKIINKLLE